MIFTSNVPREVTLCISMPFIFAPAQPTEMMLRYWSLLLHLPPEVRLCYWSLLFHQSEVMRHDFETDAALLIVTCTVSIGSDSVLSYLWPYSANRSDATLLIFTFTHVTKSDATPLTYVARMRKSRSLSVNSFTIRGGFLRMKVVFGIEKKGRLNWMRIYGGGMKAESLSEYQAPHSAVPN